MSVDKSGLTCGWKDVATGGATPEYSGVLTTGAKYGEKYWRSEIVLRSNRQAYSGVKPDYVQLHAGDSLTVSFDMWTSGFNALPSDASTTFFQLHGPTLKGTWPGPPVTLSLRAGTIRLGGGYAVPTPSGGTTTAYGSTHPTYTPYVDGQWRSVSISTVIGGTGAVSLDIQGQRVADAWAPAAGTIYTATTSGDWRHDYLYAKVGCYGYSNNATTTKPLVIKMSNIVVDHNGNWFSSVV